MHALARPAPEDDVEAQDEEVHPEEQAIEAAFAHGRISERVWLPEHQARGHGGVAGQSQVIGPHPRFGQVQPEDHVAVVQIPLLPGQAAARPPFQPPPVRRRFEQLHVLDQGVVDLQPPVLRIARLAIQRKAQPDGGGREAGRQVLG